MSLTSPSLQPRVHVRADDDLDARRRAVDARLRDYIHAAHGDGTLSAAMDHAVSGGHFWRALFVLALYEAAAGRAWTEVVDCACAVELIHCSSVALDDLPCIDDADMRRGRLSCHRVYGEAATIYASHALVAIADRIVSARARRLRTPADRLHLELAHVRRDLINGQMLEAALARGEVDADRTTLLRLCRLKGSVFRAAGAMAGRAAACPPPVFKGVLSFASTVSIIYQLVDDIADATLTAAAIGKAVGMDAEKRNFVTSRGAASARVVLDALCERARKALDRLPEPHRVEPLLDHMRAVGVRLEDTGSRVARPAAGE